MTRRVLSLCVALFLFVGLVAVPASAQVPVNPESPFPLVVDPTPVTIDAPDPAPIWVTPPPPVELHQDPAAIPVYVVPPPVGLDLAPVTVAVPAIDAYALAIDAPPVAIAAPGVDPSVMAVDLPPVYLAAPDVQPVVADPGPIAIAAPNPGPVAYMIDGPETNIQVAPPPPTNIDVAATTIDPQKVGDVYVNPPVDSIAIYRDPDPVGGINVDTPDLAAITVDPPKAGDVYVNPPLNGVSIYQDPAPVAGRTVSVPDLPSTCVPPIFVPEPPPIVIPDVPDLGGVTIPDVPDLGGVTIPDVPDLGGVTIPNLPDLGGITFPGLPGLPPIVLGASSTSTGATDGWATSTSSVEVGCVDAWDGDSVFVPGVDAPPVAFSAPDPCPGFGCYVPGVDLAPVSYDPPDPCAGVAACTIPRVDLAPISYTIADPCPGFGCYVPGVDAPATTVDVPPVAVAVMTPPPVAVNGPEENIAIGGAFAPPPVSLALDAPQIAIAAPETAAIALDAPALGADVSSLQTTAVMVDAPNTSVGQAGISQPGALTVDAPALALNAACPSASNLAIAAIDAPALNLAVNSSLQPAVMVADAPQLAVNSMAISSLGSVAIDSPQIAIANPQLAEFMIDAPKIALSGEFTQAVDAAAISGGGTDLGDRAVDLSSVAIAAPGTGPLAQAVDPGPLAIVAPPIDAKSVAIDQPALSVAAPGTNVCQTLGAVDLTQNPPPVDFVGPDLDAVAVDAPDLGPATTVDPPAVSPLCPYSLDAPGSGATSELELRVQTGILQWADVGADCYRIIDPYEKIFATTTETTFTHPALATGDNFSITVAAIRRNQVIGVERLRGSTIAQDRLEALGPLSVQEGMEILSAMIVRTTPTSVQFHLPAPLLSVTDGWKLYRNESLIATAGSSQAILTDSAPGPVSSSVTYTIQLVAPGWTSTDQELLAWLPVPEGVCTLEDQADGECKLAPDATDPAMTDPAVQDDRIPNEHEPTGPISGDGLTFALPIEIPGTEDPIIHELNGAADLVPDPTQAGAADHGQAGPGYWTSPRLDDAVVHHRTFIPLKYVDPPECPPDCNPWGTNWAFGGDDRDFGHSLKNSTRTRVSLRMDWEGDDFSYTKDVSPTKRYAIDDDGTYDYDSTKTGVLHPTIEHIRHNRSRYRFRVRHSGKNPYETYYPAIDYEWEYVMVRDGGITTRGLHDGAPNYEDFYRAPFSDGIKAVYRHQFTSFTSLAPPMDQKDRKWCSNGCPNFGTARWVD